MNKRKNGKLYCANKIIYIYDGKVTSYRGRPVLNVEVMDRKDGKVVFLTDYPVDEISLDEELFNKYFHSRW
jgi:hypothetical protein